MLGWDCSAFFDHLLVTNLRPLNAKLLVCIFWKLLAALISVVPSDILLVSNSFTICKPAINLALRICLASKNLLFEYLCVHCWMDEWTFYILQDDDDKWVSRIKDLFVFFSGSQFKHAFHEHLHYLATHCKISPPRLLSKFFTEEGTLLLSILFDLLHTLKDYAVSFVIVMISHLAQSILRIVIFLFNKLD